MVPPVAAKPAAPEKKVRAVRNLCAPAGSCEYCDRRRAYAKDMMQKHRKELAT